MILGKDNYISQNVLKAFSKYMKATYRFALSFFNPPLKKIQLTELQSFVLPRAVNQKVVQSFCLSCLKCESLCPTEALDFRQKGKPILTITSCVQCDICLDVCPKKIIEYKDYQMQNELNIFFLQKESSNQ